MYSAIIVAAGQGKRSGLPYNKVWHEINGKPLIDYSLEIFEKDIDCAEIIVVTDKQSLESKQEAYFNRVDGWIAGGALRFESVLAGIQHAKMPRVMIHDGARPAMDEGLLHRIKTQMNAYAALSPAVTVSDTLKRIEKGKLIASVDRKDVFALQTPQAFEREALLKAYQKAKGKEHSYTCDLSLFADYGEGQIGFIEGSIRNIKFTTVEDLHLLEEILK